MTKQINILAVGLALTASGACKQKSETVPAGTAVNINVLSPSEGQVYHEGDTVWMRADASYTTQMHGYALTIEGNGANNIFFDEEEHVHDDHFSINNYWVATPASPDTLRVKLAVAISHDAEPTTVTRTIYIQ